MQQLINIRKKCQVSALISTNENKGNLKHLGALAKKSLKWLWETWSGFSNDFIRFPIVGTKQNLDLGPWQ